MVQMILGFRMWFLFLIAPWVLGGCSETRVLMSLLFTEATSLSTSAFEFDEMKSGTGVTCAILGDKTLRCVGSGDKGNLGTFNGGPAAITTPVKLIAAGKEFTCYTAGENSQLFCFGKNDKGQLGNPSAGNSPKPVPVLDLDNSNSPITEVKSLSAGEAHACAALKSGRAVCWGDNGQGQLGSASEKMTGARSVMESDRSPKPFAAVKDIVAGASSTCLIARDEGALYCFGERFGSTRKLNWVPERVEYANSVGGLSSIRQVGVGRGFGCALNKAAQVYCWGQNDQHQLGILLAVKGMPKASLVQVRYPQEMALSRIEQLSVGEGHACAIHRDERSVYCWGDNRFNQLGSSSTRGETEQVALGSNNLTLKGVKEVRAGSDRTCIISVRDELFCWGNGAHGILGNPKPISVYPSRVLDQNLEALANVAHVQIGWNHACIKDQREKLYCFGINSFGQLGMQRMSGQALLSETKTLNKVASIDMRGGKTCVVYGEDQRVGCFGDVELDTANKKPLKNSFILDEIKKNNMPLRAVTGIAVGSNQLCVIGATQEVTCIPWVESPTSVAPIKVAVAGGKPLKDIWQIRSQGGRGCALSQAEGAAWCWGMDRYEQAQQAKSLTIGGGPAKELIQISLTRDRVCAIKGTEREIYCTKPDLTEDEPIDLKPVMAQGGLPLKRILMLSSGLEHFCAVTDAGQLYCWGKNSAYQFGQKQPVQSLEPLPITLKSDRIRRITRVTTGDHHTCVTSADDPSLYCFGKSLIGGANSPDPVDYPL
jgi:alpha-tubulin suppressor-like RCC1 family protein